MHLQLHLATKVERLQPVAAPARPEVVELASDDKDEFDPMVSLIG